MTRVYVGGYSSQICLYDLDPASGALSLVAAVAGSRS
jgi:hypothetical protein